ncbi:MAG: hypothetical protein U5L96_16210 [Owenweeksia sp.]|nr:hypothetical protein [Owenweeksia sp.]
MGAFTNSFNYAPGMNAALKRTAALSLPPKRGGYRLDVDAHILEHQKPDARTAYNFKQGYAPLCSFVGALPVEVEVRNGNTSPEKRYYGTRAAHHQGPGQRRGAYQRSVFRCCGLQF